MYRRLAEAGETQDEDSNVVRGVFWGVNSAFTINKRIILLDQEILNAHT